MKNMIAILCVLTLLPNWARADEDDKSVTSTLQIQGGKMVGEKREIEIYDYHSGTYQTVDVYRKPEKASKTPQDTATQTQPIQQAPR